MASRLRSILGAVKTAISAVNGAGGYVYDLSATGIVQIGEPTMSDGPQPPRVWIWLTDIAGEHGPELGGYRRSASIAVSGVVPSTSTTREEHLLAAADLLDDLSVALQADRTLGGYVLDVLVSGAPLSGAELGIPGAPAAILAVEVYYLEVGGW